MFDVVIVNYKSTPLLLECLRSIQRTGNEAGLNICVADNDSRDSIDRVIEEFSAIRLLRNHRNLGFAKAANRAMRLGKAPYVVLLNPDTQVEEHFFDRVQDFLTRHPKIGILGPKIVNSDGSTQGSARKFPTLLTSFFGRRSLMTRIFPKNPISRRCIMAKNSDGKTPLPVDWVSGACMVIRREAIEAAGYLDDNFFAYWEDADWCRRMWQSGWKVIYYPKAFVLHHGGGSSNNNVTRATFEFHVSAYRLFRKHLESDHFWLRPLIIAGLACRFVLVLSVRLMRKALGLKRKTRISRIRSSILCSSRPIR